jgi:Zn finger protein HypA/HybF involved in hydrogenase expression
MKRSPINKASTKQAAKNRAWKKITMNKIESGIVCENCHGTKTDWRGISGGHHKDPRRNGDYSPENHILLCAVCHSESHGIKEVIHE